MRKVTTQRKPDVALVPLLTVSNVHKKRENDFILKNISFRQYPFQKIAVAGETGSGKTTLLKIIAGLAQPEEGEVNFEEKRVMGLNEKLVAGHPHIAYLSQYFELQKFLRVEQILTYSNVLTERQANSIFEVCQIDHLLSRKTDELSGGEKQRIALAQLLIGSPRLLLLDEPYSHLDIIHKNILKSVIDSIANRLKITCIIVSHDPQDTLSWADEILVLRKGRIVQQGTPDVIYHQPANSYVAGLFGKFTRLSAKTAKAFGLRITSKDVLIRPEGFRIQLKKGKRSRLGIIKGIHFFGTHRQALVSVSDELFEINLDHLKRVAVGDKVFVTLADTEFKRSR